MESIFDQIGHFIIPLFYLLCKNFALCINKTILTHANLLQKDYVNKYQF